MFLSVIQVFLIQRLKGETREWRIHITLALIHILKMGIFGSSKNHRKTKKAVTAQISWLIPLMREWVHWREV